MPWAISACWAWIWPRGATSPTATGSTRPARCSRRTATPSIAQTFLLDYDAIEKQALEVKPLILLAGFSAYSRNINYARMRAIADRVGAVLMVDMAHFAGLVAGKVLQGEFNPIPYAHIATTTTHKTLRGPRGGLVLCTEEFKEHVDRGCPLVLGRAVAARDGGQGRRIYRGTPA